MYGIECLEEIVALRFFAHDSLMDCQNISSKAILVFFKNLHNFGSNMIEKQGVINLRSNSSYATVVLSDAEVTFLDKGNHAAFHLFLYLVLFDCIA